MHPLAPPFGPFHGDVWCLCAPDPCSIERLPKQVGNPRKIINPRGWGWEDHGVYQPLPTNIWLMLVNMWWRYGWCFLTMICEVFEDDFHEMAHHPLGYPACWPSSNFVARVDYKCRPWWRGSWTTVRISKIQEATIILDCTNQRGTRVFGILILVASGRGPLCLLFVIISMQGTMGTHDFGLHHELQCPCPPRPT